MKSLTQKSGFKTITYTIEDTGLMRKIATKGGDSEFHYPFEQIRINKVSLLEHNKVTLGIAGIFSAIALFVFILSFSDKTVEPIAAPLWLSISLILLVYYFKTRVRKLYLQTTENVTLEFLATKPGKEEVNEFIEQLLHERNVYLFSKYGQLNRNLEYATQLDNLNWLLNNRVISKVRYDEMIQELNGLFNTQPGNKPIGFTSNN